MDNNHDDLREAKQRLRIPDLWRRLSLPGTPAKSCRSPWRDDANPSFSIFDEGRRWRDFGTDEGGDAIDFLARVQNLPMGDAIVEFKRLAGVNSASCPRADQSAPTPHPASAFDWAGCVAAFTADHQQRLTAWRGYSTELVTWLHGQKLIGWFDAEHFAFPVHDAEGRVLGCHYRLERDSSWRYAPAGTRTAPLILGDIAGASQVWAFESQWDLFALLDVVRWHAEPPADTAAVATRGASNGRLIAGRCSSAATVVAFPQNDPPGEKWLQDIARGCGCECLRGVTPARHKDFNDWARAGATATDLTQTIAAALPVEPPSVPDLRGPPPPRVSARVVLPREEDEDHVCDEPRPFPVEALAPPLALIASAVARCERVPVALPAVCALGIASAALGAGLEVVSGPDRTTRANLFLLASAESGSGKSVVFRRIAEPLVAHQQRLQEGHRLSIAPQLASEIAVLTREIASIEKKAARSSDPAERDRLVGELTFRNARKVEFQQRAAMPCLLVGDVTSEKLAVLLAGNREVLLSASPEARQIVDIICGRYSSTKATDESIYLSGFSGDFVRVDRLGRDPLTLRRPCLSLLWLVQPDALSRLFDEETLAQSGFLPRFLLCHTLAAPRPILPGEAPAVSDATTQRWSGLIDALLATYRAAEKPCTVHPTADAKAALDRYFNRVVERRGGDLADVGSFAARYGEQAWRVALVLHAALHAADAHLHELNVETARNAIALVEWFTAAQLDILSCTRRQAATKLEDEVLELIATNADRRRQAFTTAREVQRARIVPTAEAARSLLARLEADGTLVGEEVAPEGGGKTTRIFRRPQNPVPE